MTDSNHTIKKIAVYTTAHLIFLGLAYLIVQSGASIQPAWLLIPVALITYIGIMLLAREYLRPEETEASLPTAAASAERAKRPSHRLFRAEANTGPLPTGRPTSVVLALPTEPPPSTLDTAQHTLKATGDAAAGAIESTQLAVGAAADAVVKVTQTVAATLTPATTAQAPTSAAARPLSPQTTTSPPRKQQGSPQSTTSSPASRPDSPQERAGNVFFAKTKKITAKAAAAFNHVEQTLALAQANAKAQEEATKAAKVGADEQKGDDEAPQRPQDPLFELVEKMLRIDQMKLIERSKHLNPFDSTDPTAGTKTTENTLPNSQLEAALQQIAKKWAKNDDDANQIQLVKVLRWALQQPQTELEDLCKDIKATHKIKENNFTDQLKGVVTSGQYIQKSAAQNAVSDMVLDNLARASLVAAAQSDTDRKIDLEQLKTNLQCCISDAVPAPPKKLTPPRVTRKPQQGVASRFRRFANKLGTGKKDERFMAVARDLDQTTRP